MFRENPLRVPSIRDCSNREEVEAQHEQVMRFLRAEKDSIARGRISIKVNEETKYHHRGRTEDWEPGT